jgi:hypothetical protein
VSSGALLAGVVEQPLRDVLPDRVPAIQSDCIGGLDFHGPLAATAGDPQHVALNLGKTSLPHLSSGRIGARVFEHRSAVFGREGRIRSRKRTQNAFIESFNARLRDELLNETLFTSLAQARAVLATWKDDYNNPRPHSALGNLTPTEYAKRSVPGLQRGGTLRYAEGSAPRPVALPSPMGSHTTRILPIVG